MMKLIYFLLPIILFGEEIALSSDTISYKGKTLLLQGNVSVKHPMATVKADLAEIIDVTKTSFLQAILRSNVELLFQEDRLIAEEIVIDPLSNKISTKGPAKFFATKQHFHLSCDGSTVFNKTAMNLSFKRGAFPITFVKEDITVYATTAQITFENNKPYAIIFDQDVELIKGQTKGRASVLFYRIQDHHIVLTGTKAEQVQFYHEEKQATISADALQIDKGGEYETIQGIGKVRLTLQSDDADKLLETWKEKQF